MLSIPEHGFRRSVKHHNCDLTIVCDWIEASLLADESVIYKQQVSDILVEQAFYDRGGVDAETMRSTFLDNIWLELRRRSQLAGTAAHYAVSHQRITKSVDLSRSLPSMFLLLLSCSDYYRTLREAPFANYGEQGALFEEFCYLSLAGLGWEVQRTGWTSQQGAQKLKATVEAVAAATGETAVNEQWINVYKDKNEAGCDLVSFLSFPDGREGRPLYLVQCASGSDYTEKLGTPDLGMWRKLVAFSVEPQRGFCTPRAFEDQPFLSIVGQVDGWLLERHRLLHPFASGAAVLPPKLGATLKKWIAPRLKALPRLR